ncbi:hypothetical protein CES86_2819 [Brucella lupini]|uniref:Uncharacterized protein n=1 Tax=Brucella lupini TaxID=255457 RepID=A0A256GNA6_9HYPH|nr:hypothetical protein CES86_2819 [Brucella lupini]
MKPYIRANIPKTAIFVLRLPAALFRKSANSKTTRTGNGNQ